MSTKIKSALREHSKAVVAFVALLATLALLFSAMFVGISNADYGVDIPNTSSDLKDNGESYLDIIGANLEYSDYLHIIYAVESNLDDGDYSEVKMIFWNTPQTEYIYGNHIAQQDRRPGDPTSITIGNTVYESCYSFLSEGIAAKEIGDVIYARAYVTDKDGEMYYSNVVKYSVLDYVYSRYRDAEILGNVSEEQLDLYNNILLYGSKAQIILDYKTERLVNSHAVRIDVIDGHITDGFDFGTYLAGDSLTLVADMENENGKFLCWIDSDGATVSTDRVLNLKIDNSSVSESYTAVYAGITTVNVVGGTLDGGAASGRFANGEQYSITAADPALFRYWIDETGAIVGDTATLTLTAGEGNVIKTYTAVCFEPAKVTVSGGTLYGDDGEGNVGYGKKFVIEADDRSADKYVFKAWVDQDGKVVSTSSAYETIVVPDLCGKTLSYTATYYAPTTVTVTGGTVNGSSSVTLAYGESYTVSANIPIGYLFTSWTKNGVESNLTESFTAIAGDGESINYEVCFEVSGGASFDGVSGALTSGTPIVSDGYTVTLNGSSADFGAEIVNDPKDPSNKVIKFNDNDTNLAGSLSVDVIGGGDFLSFKSLICFESFSTGDVLDVSFGDAYGIRFTAVENKALKIFDISKDSTTAIGYLDQFVRPGEWFELSVIVTSTNGVNGKAPRAFVYIDGICVAESYNVAQKALASSVAFSAAKATTAVVLLDEIQTYRTTVSSSAEESIDSVRVFEEISTTSSDRLQNAEILLGKEAYENLKAMDEKLFSEAVYEWAANLYDPETGGFYFSISGRDNYGYLADIETTSQMSGVLNQLGIGSYSNLLNDEQKAAMLSWAQMLESNRDGYNYHPQWGISIGDSRRSRDYSYASTLYSASGSLRFRLFDDANYRLSGGISGSKGVTVSVNYDNSKNVTLTAYTNNLKMPLGVSTEAAVSKAILAASTTGESNIPVHMRSEEAFVGYINGKWNSGCSVPGTHERHLCTSSCVQVDDPNDSYMELKNGKVEFIRGKRCTSCHECKHSVGHSYGFASVIGTQNSQIASLGLGDLLVMYYYDVQENVQANLRHKVELAYTSNNGQYAWDALSNVSRNNKAAAVTSITDAAKSKAETDYNVDNGAGSFAPLSSAKKQELYKMAQAELSFVADVNANGSRIWASLSDEQKADLKKQNQNGIWEEEVTYGTISGLLKACGTPGAHGYEFLYAEDAIQSAIDCALFSVYDFTSRRESVVSIYNPFNAINGVFGNIRNYGKDKTVIDRCVELVRSQAAELIENTTGKLEGYKMPDGGFSYSYGGYCVTSQGQPVAVNGWNNGVGEGDVNGTALAFGTRSALLEILTVSVNKPFSGENNKIEGGYDLNGNGNKTDAFDLDGDGVAEVLEATCTHSQRFMYLITTKEQIEKVDVIGTGEEFVFTFEDGIKGSGGTIITEEGTNNKVLEVIDDKNPGGVYTNFTGKCASSDETRSQISFKMKAVKANNTVTHQIFLPDSSGNYVLQVNMTYSNGSFSFTNIAASSKDLGISVKANKWFTVEIDIRPEGFTSDGKTYYGIFKVTQDGTTQTAYLSELKKHTTVLTLSMYSLSSAITTTLYDDVKVFSTIRGDIHDGEYHFDTISQQIAGNDVIVDNPTTESYDRVFLLNGSGYSFGAYKYSVDDYTTNNVRYNFNSVQLGLLLNEAKDGDRVDIVMLDGAGRKINGIYLTVSEYEGNKLVTFHAPNGDVLEESIPRTITNPDGSVSSGEKLREMILDVNTAKWMTIKIEYHYDMANPQLDISVRYSDDIKSGYYTTTAASLTGIDVCEVGADAYNFADLSVKATGKIYLDDLYIRNVYDPCDGNHVFIRKATKAFLTGDSFEGHELYFTSCQKCGAKGDETFVVHTYVKEVAEAYKVADATIHSAAVYREHCSVCNHFSDDTFVYGYPLDDPSKHNFSKKDDEGNIIKDSTIPSYLSYSTGAGKWATVKEEMVGNVVNYYLNIGKDYYYVEDADGNPIKKENVGTNAVTFCYPTAKDEAIADKYIYEFDFRWLYATEQSNDVIYAKVGYYNPTTAVKKEYGSSGAFQSSSTGNYVNYHGKTLYSGEWHSLKYLFTRTANDQGWELTTFIDGTKVNTLTFTGNGVPYVNLETRYPRTDGGVRYPNNMSFDIDRLKATKITTVGHIAAEVIDRRYLKEGATCESPAVYYKSCEICGDVLEETFTVGTVTGHEYANVLDDAYLKDAASCESAAVYYKSCKICREASDSATFTVGSPLGHNDIKTVISEATKETAEISCFTCQRCGRKTEPVVVGEPLSHTFDKDAMPSNVTIIGFKTGGEVPAEGIWARVLSEEVNGAVNYYLNIGKANNGSTHNLAFTPNIPSGAKKVIFEMDLRYNSASKTGDTGVFVKFLNPEYNDPANGYMLCHSMTTYSSYASLYGDKYTAGKWYTLRFEFTIADDGKTSYEVFFNGTSTETGTLDAMVTKLVFETRYGYTHINLDIDNVYIKYE